MSIFKRFGKARTAGKYFNEANKYWKLAEQPFRAKDEFALANNLIDVIRNCQLAIAEDENHGDAYVLLADALLLGGVSDPIKADEERSWYLITRAAAVIHIWWTLPNRNYPITKNVNRGEKLFRTILDIVNAGELEAKKDPMKLINSYREQYADNTISLEGLEEISDVLLNRSYQRDTEYSQTQSDELSSRLTYTDEIENRLIELKKAASDCGLSIELAVNDVAEACKEANKIKADTLEEKTRKWWPAFFKAYGGICVGRWQRQCIYLIDDAAKKKLWLDQFEPVWVAGCNYNKATVIRNMRNTDKQIDPRKMAKVNIRDKIKLDEYLDGVAKDVNEILSSEIIKFKSLQRDILFKVIDNAPH